MTGVGTITAPFDVSIYLDRLSIPPSDGLILDYTCTIPTFSVTYDVVATKVPGRFVELHQPGAHLRAVHRSGGDVRGRSEHQPGGAPSHRPGWAERLARTAELERLLGARPGRRSDSAAAADHHDDPAAPSTTSTTTPGSTAPPPVVVQPRFAG